MFNLSGEVQIESLVNQSWKDLYFNITISGCWLFNFKVLKNYAMDGMCFACLTCVLTCNSNYLVNDHVIIRVISLFYVLETFTFKSCQQLCLNEGSQL